MLPSGLGSHEQCSGLGRLGISSEDVDPTTLVTKQANRWEPSSILLHEDSCKEYNQAQEISDPPPQGVKRSSNVRKANVSSNPLLTLVLLFTPRAGRRKPCIPLAADWDSAPVAASPY